MLDGLLLDRRTHLKLLIELVKVWSIKDQNLDEDLALVYKKMMYHLL